MPESLLEHPCGCGPVETFAGRAALVDRTVGAALAQTTSGLSPASVLGAFGDWLNHLALPSGKVSDLAVDHLRRSCVLAGHAQSVALGADAKPLIQLAPLVSRFVGAEWRTWLFSFIEQAFLLGEDWWDKGCCFVGGVTQRHEDQLAPTNFTATNSVVQRQISENGGQCLIEGALNWLDDMTRNALHESPKGTDAFRPGIEVAVTPGEVVFSNHLIELSQHRPTTETVRPEPLLIVPAWIMKYYIFDLSPGNSLVCWLARQGFTVFMISWRNPDAADRDIGFDDYRRLGIMPALETICPTTGAPRIHAAGHCLGGTMLAVTAAAMARDGDDRLAGMTLFAAQTEFSEPGELGLFIDASQINFLENPMWAQGYLDSRQMGGAFQLLRSNDLIWSRLVQDYLMGEAERMNDLMAWNADARRLPQAMHSQYLRQLFLDDALAEGHCMVERQSVALSDVRCPIFAVGTEWDHVAPWKSVFKIHMLTETEMTFPLTSGGHNAGIVSEHGHPDRHFRLMTHAATLAHLDPDAWLKKAEVREGSWWPAWGAWLGQRSGSPCPVPPLGNAAHGEPPLGPAPGRYVQAN